MIFKPHRVSPTLTDSWLSRETPTDAPKKRLFCEVRQGGGAFGKASAFSKALGGTALSGDTLPII